MAPTVRGAIRELMEQTMATMDAPLEASDRELTMPSSHACAQGKDAWTLITNDIDHEKIHTAQILEARYESRIPVSPMQRLVAEWLAERARLIGSFIGLTDEQLPSTRRTLGGTDPAAESPWAAAQPRAADLPRRPRIPVAVHNASLHGEGR
jgi:hypothetical protein